MEQIAPLQLDCNASQLTARRSLQKPTSSALREAPFQSRCKPDQTLSNALIFIAGAIVAMRYGQGSAAPLWRKHSGRDVADYRAKHATELANQLG
jgi:hypothetical protein